MDIIDEVIKVCNEFGWSNLYKKVYYKGFKYRQRKTIDMTIEIRNEIIHLQIIWGSKPTEVIVIETISDLFKALQIHEKVNIRNYKLKKILSDEY